MTSFAESVSVVGRMRAVRFGCAHNIEPEGGSVAGDKNQFQYIRLFHKNHNFCLAIKVILLIIFGISLRHIRTSASQERPSGRQCMTKGAAVGGRLGARFLYGLPTDHYIFPCAIRVVDGNEGFIYLRGRYGGIKYAEGATAPYENNNDYYFKSIPTNPVQRHIAYNWS